MNTERLLRLAEHLDTVKPEDFDLSIWRSKIREGSCGTVGCAIGHAANIPEFREAGLHLEVSCDNLAPVYKQFSYWEAVECFFDISEGSALTLFSTRSYSTGQSTPPSMVAARIREFVIQHQETFKI